MKRVLETLCITIVVAVFCMAGYIATIEFLDLRQRVERIEQQLEEPIELEIIIPDIVVPFGEPTPAPPLLEINATNAT
jgi:hypothetical protein